MSAPPCDSLAVSSAPFYDKTNVEAHFDQLGDRWLQVFSRGTAGGSDDLVVALCEVEGTGSSCRPREESSRNAAAAVARGGRGGESEQTQALAAGGNLKGESDGRDARVPRGLSGEPVAYEHSTLIGN